MDKGQWTVDSIYIMTFNYEPLQRLVTSMCLNESRQLPEPVEQVKQIVICCNKYSSLDYTKRLSTIFSSNYA